MHLFPAITNQPAVTNSYPAAAALFPRAPEPLSPHNSQALPSMACMTKAIRAICDSQKQYTDWNVRND